MKGGFNNPPNWRRWWCMVMADEPRDASMKGGFNNPPNPIRCLSLGMNVPRAASMKGGFNNPPNLLHPPMPWLRPGATPLQ